MSEPVWPAPKDSCSLSPDELVAIGMITINFNEVEDYVKEFTALKLGRYQTIPQFVRRLSNRDRVDLFKGLIDETVDDPEIRSAYLSALAHYDICTENRNIVLHSTHSRSNDDGVAGFLEKYSSGDMRTKTRYLVKLEDLRRVADEMSALGHYLLDIAMYELSLKVRVPSNPGLYSLGFVPASRTLPETPPAPRKLTPLPTLGGRKGGKSPPESSGA